MPKSRGSYVYEFPRPSVTVDVAVVTRERRPRVLLIRRGHAPYAGMWALPGGFIDMDETLEVSARRELREETGLQVKRLEQLATYGDPGRDPRGRTISVVYLARCGAKSQIRAGDDAAEAEWHPLQQLPPLAFDHTEILALVRKKVLSEERNLA